MAVSSVICHCLNEMTQHIKLEQMSDKIHSEVQSFPKFPASHAFQNIIQLSKEAFADNSLF